MRLAPGRNLLFELARSLKRTGVNVGNQREQLAANQYDELFRIRSRGDWIWSACDNSWISTKGACWLARSIARWRNWSPTTATLARAFIHALGHEGPVPSPTYTLVEPYQLPQTTVYHVDLYRVSDEEELRYLGWNELDAGLRIVEWPERAPGLAASADLLLTLAYEKDGRRLTLSGLSERGAALARTLSP